MSSPDGASDERFQVVPKAGFVNWPAHPLEEFAKENIRYQRESSYQKDLTKTHKDTVWLSIDQMADLFQRNKSTISRHIKNVLESGELAADSVVAFFATVQNEDSEFSPINKGCLKATLIYLHPEACVEKQVPNRLIRG